MEALAIVLVLAALVMLVVLLALGLLAAFRRQKVNVKQMALLAGATVLSFVVGLALIPAPDKTATNMATVVNGPTSESGGSAAAVPPAEPKTVTLSLPDTERAFLQAIVDARNEYQNAGNDLKKTAVKVRRDRAVVKAVPHGQAKGWYGKISNVTTTGDSRAAVTIELPADGVYVKTWNNSLSDIQDNTLIGFDTPLYTALSEMSEGQWVKFDARLIREGSLTEQGGVTEPEYVARFSSIEPAMASADGTPVKATTE